MDKSPNFQHVKYGLFLCNKRSVSHFSVIKKKSGDKQEREESYRYILIRKTKSYLNENKGEQKGDKKTYFVSVRAGNHHRL